MKGAENLQRGKNRVSFCSKPNNTNCLLSPSDSTIYENAVNRDRANDFSSDTDFDDNSPPMQQRISGVRVADIDDIDRLIAEERMKYVSLSTSGRQVQQSDERQNQVPGTSGARKQYDPVVEAEKSKAVMENPPGRSWFDSSFATDDQYFSFTSHVEDSIVKKAERGQFVNLARLLDRNKAFNHDGELQWCPGGE